MQIRIIEVPPGAAPPEIREAWVGCVIPIMTTEEQPQGTFAGIDGSKAQNNGGYAVYALLAVDALRRKGATTAADWWQNWLRQNATILSNPPVFRFRKEVCKVVS